MEQWSTRVLPKDPDRASPSGAAAIRLLPSFDEGEIAHATVMPDTPSTAATLSGVGEFYYVLEGQGSLWRATGPLEDVVQLRAARCVTVPPGIDYQFVATGTPITVLAVTTPRWAEDDWHRANRHHWDEHGVTVTGGGRRPGPWHTKDLPATHDYLAPDSSEIRLLPSFDGGGLAHCRLPAGKVSVAVRHRTVKEIWYVLSGRGQVWRGDDTDQEVVDVSAGTCLTIPTGVGFQFRAGQGAPLDILIATFPAWPGAQEAEGIPGHWTA